MKTTKRTEKLLEILHDFVLAYKEREKIEAEIEKIDEMLRIEIHTVEQFDKFLEEIEKKAGLLYELRTLKEEGAKILNALEKYLFAQFSPEERIELERVVIRIDDRYVQIKTKEYSDGGYIEEIKVYKTSPFHDSADGF